MSKTKKVNKSGSDLPDEDQIESLLSSKEYSGLHFGSRSGDDITAPDIISTGSVFFDAVLDGGFRSSMWARFYSPPECGKSAQGLFWGAQWQRFYPDDGVVVLFNAEGRASLDMIKRSGIDTSKERFRVIDTNYSEVIWGMIEKLVTNNPDKNKYFFIVDSTDACVRLQDSQTEKAIGDAEKIGGSATILSAAGKRLSLIFNRTNHFLYMCSQVRDKVNTHGPTAGGKDASGGNAPKFYSSLTGEIKPPWSDTYIFENPSDKKSKIIGRLVEIKLHKTFNEKTGAIVRIPVKYGQVGGIWKAYEAMMVCQSWGWITQLGSRYAFSDEFYAELLSNNINVSQKFHGEKVLLQEFESSNELTDFVISKIRKLIF